MIAAIKAAGPTIGYAPACAALGLARATFYRHKGPGRVTRARARPQHALTCQEKAEVLSVLHEDRFMDLAPTEVYAQLLDEGRHLCSIRTMYRILAANHEVRERRRQLARPAYKKPELMATGPNQVWSWDITKLMGPQKWTYYYLYVLLDIFSRYVVGWLIAERESAALAKQLIAESCARQSIEQGKLTIHADNGAAMISKTLAQTMGTLGEGVKNFVYGDSPWVERFC